MFGGYTFGGGYFGDGPITAPVPDLPDPSAGGGGLFMLQTDPFSDRFREPFRNDPFRRNLFPDAKPRRQR